MDNNITTKTRVAMRYNILLFVGLITVITLVFSCKGEGEFYIPVEEDKPTPFACITVATTMCELGDCTITFSAGCSRDANIYNWDFNNDGTPEEEGNAEDTKEEVVFTFEEIGKYEIKLEVFNANGMDDTLIVFDVQRAIIPPSISFDVNIDNCTAPCEICLENIQVAGDIEEFVWGFGDGTEKSVASLPSELCHTYTQSGEFTISLSATGLKGDINTDTKQANISQKSYELELIDWDDSQKAIVGEEYPIPLKVKIKSTDPNEDLSGIEVQFEIVSGNGEIENNGYVLSNEIGIASINWRLGEVLFSENTIELNTVKNVRIDNPALFSIIPNYFRDSRDSKVYRTTKIDNNIWMAENLNYSNFGLCYNDKESNCEEYGRLYTWFEANDGIVCPDGWRLPSYEEINGLILQFDMSSLMCCQEHWDTRIESAFNIDFNNSSGFSLKPSGYIKTHPAGCPSRQCSFQLRERTQFWSSTEHQSLLFSFSIETNRSTMEISTRPDIFPYYSCRCIKK